MNRRTVTLYTPAGTYVWRNAAGRYAAVQRPLSAPRGERLN